MMCTLQLKKLFFSQVLQLDTGSTVDTLHAGFSEELAKGILLL